MPYRDETIQKKYIKEYQELYKEEIKQYKKEYYIRNKIKHSKQMKKWRTKYPSRVIELNQRYYKKHKEKCVIQALQYHNNRIKIDLNYRLRDYLRNRIWKALKGICKSKRTMELVGCSIKKLKQHLEKQFKPGMSFKNYGKWHIDHIKPCASFDLRKKSEQKKCFNWQNLQPLWAKDNLKKSDKY